MSKIKGPQQKTVLDADVIVLRKIDWKQVPPGLVDILAETNLEPGVQERQMAWFDDGFISNDHPRTNMVAHAIRYATVGYAVARTDTGEILSDFGMDLPKAAAAAASAKIRLDVDVMLADAGSSDDESENLEDDDPAGV